MIIRTIKARTTIKAMPATRRRCQLYSDVAWQKTSAAWVQQYPLCVLCLVRGEHNVGQQLVVDHIEPHGGDINRFWNQDNWQTLCKACHDGCKQRHERRGGTAASWFTYLRDEMVKHNTTQHVQQLAAWLPPAMCRRLVGDRGMHAGDRTA